MRRADIARVRVKLTETDGRRVYLRLRCGHSKLHDTRRAIPKWAYCRECPAKGGVIDG